MTPHSRYDGLKQRISPPQAALPRKCQAATEPPTNEEPWHLTMQGRVGDSLLVQPDKVKLSRKCPGCASPEAERFALRGAESERRRCSEKLETSWGVAPRRPIGQVSSIQHPALGAFFSAAPSAGRLSSCMELQPCWGWRGGPASFVPGQQHG